jgi:hypothetical protein
MGPRGSFRFLLPLQPGWTSGRRSKLRRRSRSPSALYFARRHIPGTAQTDGTYGSRNRIPSPRSAPRGESRSVHWRPDLGGDLPGVGIELDEEELGEDESAALIGLAGHGCPRRPKGRRAAERRGGRAGRQPGGTWGRIPARSTEAAHERIIAGFRASGAGQRTARAPGNISHSHRLVGGAISVAHRTGNPRPGSSPVE